MPDEPQPGSQVARGRAPKKKAQPSNPKGKARKPKAEKDIGLNERGADGIPLTERETKRRRLYYIAQIMAAGEWEAKLAGELGKEWKLSKKTVQNYSAEAGRIVDFTTGQREKLVTLARVRLRQVMLEDESDRVQAARTLLESMGELRQNITTRQVPDRYEGWTQEELDEFARTGKQPQRPK